jgi:hypothetical protein
MNINPDDPTLEDIVSIEKGLTIKKIPEKNSRQEQVYRRLRERGHDKKSAKKLASISGKEKTGIKKIVYEGIASQTVGGTIEDSIDTASDIIGLNSDNIKGWSIGLEWGMNYFSTKQIEWLVEGISTGTDAAFGFRIPEDVKAGISQSYFWGRYAFTAFRQYKWSVKDKYIPSYLSWITPSTAIFAVPSVAYEGWLMLRRHVLNIKENALNRYDYMKEYFNEKLNNGNGYKNGLKKDDNLPTSS